MILHIAPDEKFIDRAYRAFEKVNPNKNVFLITSNDKELTFTKDINCKRISYLTLLKKEFIDNLKNYDFVVLHWLDDWKMRLVLKANKSVKFLWIGWGGDYYDYIIDNKFDLFLYKTQELAKELDKNQDNSKKFDIKMIVKRVIFNRLNREKAIERINFFSPVLDIEYEMLNRKHNFFRAEFIRWNYGELNDNLKGLVEVKDKNNILLGNSATLENNHIETIDIVKNLDLKDRKIIMPLSYGDLNYAKKVTQYAKRNISEKNIETLIGFLELEKYNKLISSCGIAIMNHLRQQAYSNIIAILWSGGKVFLNEKNPLYKFLINKGMLIFKISDLSNEHLSSTLSKEEIKKNRTLLSQMYGSDTMMEQTINLIDKIKSS